MDDLDDIMSEDDPMIFEKSDPNEHNKNKRGQKRSLSTMRDGDSEDIQLDLQSNPNKKRKITSFASKRSKSNQPKHLTRACRASSPKKQMKDKPKRGE